MNFTYIDGTCIPKTWGTFGFGGEFRNVESFIIIVTLLEYNGLQRQCSGAKCTFSTWTIKVFSVRICFMVIYHGIISFIFITWWWTESKSLVKERKQSKLEKRRREEPRDLKVEFRKHLCECCLVTTLEFVFVFEGIEAKKHFKAK